MGKTVLRYSEAFKRKVVSELECGKLASVTEAQRRYGIKGALTVRGWVRSLGKNHLLSKVVRVETADEALEVERLRKRVAELERTLAQTQVESVMSQALVKVIWEDFGQGDLSEFKKKLDAGPCRRRAGKEGAR